MMNEEALASVLAEALAALTDSSGGLLFVKFPQGHGDMESPQEDTLSDLNTENEASGGSSGRYGGGNQDMILMDNPSQ